MGIIKSNTLCGLLGFIMDTRTDGFTMDTSMDGFTMGDLLWILGCIYFVRMTNLFNVEAKWNNFFYFLARSNNLANFDSK